MDVAVKLAFFILPTVLLSPLPEAKSQTWQAAEPLGLPVSRCECGMAEVNGKLYLLGGRGERPVDEYDPKEDHWTTKAKAPIEIHHFQAVTYNSEIYVMGAFTGSFPHEQPVPDIYIYNPASDVWRKGGPMPAHRLRGATGALVWGNKIYVIGGIQDGHYDGHVAWFDVFDPKTNQWSQLPDAPRPRDHAAVAVLDGRLYATGGRLSTARTNQLFNRTVPELDIYDFKSGKWSTAEHSLPTPRAGATMVAFDGQVWVIGGESIKQDPAHSLVEAFSPKTNQWKPLPALVDGRHGTQAVVYNGKIYIAAGCGQRGGDQELNALEIYRK